MTKDIPDSLLDILSKCISSQVGIHFPEDRWPDLKRGIKALSSELGFKDTGDCINSLISSSFTRDRIETLASHITVGETYFFREKAVFEALEKKIFPDMIQKKMRTGRRIKIWSAGCATGEEPYSIAILLKKIIPAMENWDITILGTDINIKFLKKASQGNYRHWSFRTTPDEIKKQYFIKNKESFQIIPFIKRMVRFDYLNLAEDSYPSLLNNTSGIDLILCRNVIMYFNQQCQKKVIQKFYRSLVDGGWLIVAASETSNLLFSQFQTVNFTDAFLYKKNLHAKNSEPVFPDELIESTHYFYTPFQDQSPPADPNKQPEPGVSDYDVETTKKSSEKQPRPISYEEALFLYEAGQYSEAEKALLSIVDHEPRAVVLLVRVYANKGQIENSLSWCEKAVKKDKMNPDIHFLMSTILQEKGEINQAIKSLKRVLYLKSNFVMAHFSLGSIALKQGKNKEASRHFKNALLLAGNYDKNEILRESDGITAGRLLEITGKMTEGSITI